VIAATTLLVIVPILVVNLFSQRAPVSGVLASATKE
jgi:ABC-type glycerol-3-phosphate transport system permease component